AGEASVPEVLRAAGEASVPEVLRRSRETQRQMYQATINTNTPSNARIPSDMRYPLFESHIVRCHSAGAACDSSVVPGPCSTHPAVTDSKARNDMLVNQYITPVGMDLAR